jgi:hypothetical protein
MLERFRRTRDAEDVRGRRAGGVATAEGASERGNGSVRERDREPVAAPVRERAGERERLRDARARSREEFGGVNWGAAFFGFLVAVGLAAILAGILSAAGAALGLTEVSESQIEQNVETIGVVGGIVLVAILGVSYFAGGYVSGRMSRFDGARQGAGAWVIGLLVTIALGVAAAIAGAEYNVFERLDLPRIPVDEGTLTVGGGVVLALAALAALLCALAGGRLGERYHRRVDRAVYGRAD